MYGFEVFSPEVDDHGVDFIARYQRGRWIEVQSKSKRESGYVFMRKAKFLPSPTLYASVAVFTDGRLPNLYLIPSTAWKTPSSLLVVTATITPQSGASTSRSETKVFWIIHSGFDDVVASLLQMRPK